MKIGDRVRTTKEILIVDLMDSSCHLSEGSQGTICEPPADSDSILPPAHWWVQYDKDFPERLICTSETSMEKVA